MSHLKAHCVSGCRCCLAKSLCNGHSIDYLRSQLFWRFTVCCRLGLDPKMLAKILNMSSGRCWSSEVYNPCPGVLEGVPSSNQYKGGFGTALMTKVSPPSAACTREALEHLSWPRWVPSSNQYKGGFGTALVTRVSPPSATCTRVALDPDFNMTRWVPLQQPVQGRLWNSPHGQG